MTIDAYALKNLVERELQNLSDVRVLSHIRGFLVEPNAFLLHWDYGVPGQQFPCWVVLADPKSNGAIAYCEYGFERWLRFFEQNLRVVKWELLPGLGAARVSLS